MFKKSKGRLFWKLILVNDNNDLIKKAKIKKKQK